VTSRLTDRRWFCCPLNIWQTQFCISDACPSLNDSVTRWIFCWRSKHFNQYFLLLFTWLLWNYLLILRMITETLLTIPFSITDIWSLVLTSCWLKGKCVRNNLSQTVSSTILQNNRRLPLSIFSVKIASLGSLQQRVTGRIFKILNF